jgi:glycosyltransferase involved in cell wall biosynthesis
MKFKKIFTLFFCLSGFEMFCEDKSFVIVTASYNNKAWLQRNLDSVIEQKYDNWRMIYINDNSSDGTGELAQAYITTHGLESKIKLINNNERYGHLFNQFYAIHSCNENEIIVILDGDDWFAHDRVFDYLNKVYQNSNVWLTYGQFVFLKKNVKGICRNIPADVIKNNSIRTFCEWNYSHVRTFYAALFKRVKQEDLMLDGDFLPMAADVATMYPMLEMCGTRFRFISDVLYVYNDTNELSFFHNQANKQKEIRTMICHKQKYERLGHALFN